MKQTEKKLTPKQSRFISEYLVDLNATQAAIRAGYSKKTAQVIAAQNLNKLIIQEEISKNLKKLEEKTEISQELWVEELRSIGFAKITDYLSFTAKGVKLKESSKLTQSQLAAVSEVSESGTGKHKSISFKLHSKLKALEQLGKHFNWIIDKHELTGKDGGSLKVSGLTDEELLIIAKGSGSGASKKTQGKK